LCSLPPGGERLTGSLRSKAFILPGKLRFFIAGHNGYPGQPANNKNLVRLRATEGEKIIAEAFAPRNDVAQPIEWDLSSHRGARGYLEIVDGDTGDAYAWVAAGRFEPPVVAVPTISPNAIAARQQAGADLARTLPLPRLEPKLTQILLEPTTEMDVCAASARALAAFKSNEVLIALAPLAGDPALQSDLRGKVKQVLTQGDQQHASSVLAEAMRIAPARLQLRLAQSLAGSTEGAETLLKLVENKEASPRLLVERSVKEKISAAKPSEGESRIKRLTEGVSPASAESQKLIDAKRAAFDPTRTKSARGLEVFTQSCQVCHQIDGAGSLIGPQLDGIGNRGLERVLEDILDPNRNVDPAFQSSILVLKEGDVMSGLSRRQEGETLVLADSTGKEFSVPNSQIAERRPSTSSLMPENFADIIPADDFNHLVAYLLSNAGKQASAR
jgi:putative heme-binding domain-containing protein